MSASDHTPPPRGSGSPRVEGATNPARRRLLKGGAAATPVVWAVTTRPARANGECQAPSAWGSVNTSAPRQQAQLCSGYLPEYWQNPSNFANWPPPYHPETDPNVGGAVASAFHGTGSSGYEFGSKTMLEVLRMAGQGATGDLGAHIAAALLNAQAGLTPVLTTSRVLALWNECASRGYYEPTAGIQWGPEKIVAYLQTTMTG